MNMKEIQKWAQGIDPSAHHERKRHRIRCYRDMILEKSQRMAELTDKLTKYQADIEEYVTQLGKENIFLVQAENVPETPMLAEVLNTPVTKPPEEQDILEPLPVPKPVGAVPVKSPILP